jgi:carbon monoxide dehydrogenase subunit G
LERLIFPVERALSDLHASAEYRAHLVKVLCRRAVASTTGEVLQHLARKFEADAKVDSSEATLTTSRQDSSPTIQEPGFGGSFQLKVSPEDVWRALFDPALLQPCIPGCETLSLVGESHYLAKIRVGFGPLAARFSTRVDLQDLQHPEKLLMIFQGSAGALGSGQGRVTISLLREPEGTRFNWQAQVQTSGRLAQLGNRLMEASARKLSGDFFERFEAALRETSPNVYASLSPKSLSESDNTPGISIKARVLRVWRRLVAIIQGR